MKSSILLLLCVAALLFYLPGCKNDKGDPNPTTTTTTTNNNNNSNNGNNGNNNPGDNPTPVDTTHTHFIKPSFILTETTYKHLVIELATIAPTVSDDGTGISSKAYNNFSAFINSRVNKTGTSSITFRGQSIPATKGAKMTADDLRKFEKKYRKDSVRGDTVFVWIPILDAEYAPDPSPDIIFGAAYSSSSFAIFEKKLDQFTLRDMVSRFTLETFVLEHEFCHMLGLTNAGTAMTTPHQDTAHGHHCNNSNCLMYWKADQSIDLTDLLGDGDKIPVLDANCLADLKAAGGK